MISVQSKTMNIDRHKTPRIYKCGFTKLQEKKEKQKKEQQILDQTPLIKNYFQSRPIELEKTDASSDNNETLIVAVSSFSIQCNCFAFFFFFFVFHFQVVISKIIIIPRARQMI